MRENLRLLVRPQTPSEIPENPGVSTGRTYRGRLERPLDPVVPPRVYDQNDDSLYREPRFPLVHWTHVGVGRRWRDLREYFVT